MLFNWKKKEASKLNDDKSPEMRYVKPDDPTAIEKDAVIKKGILGKTHIWERQSQSIARSLRKSEMRGWLSKNVVVSPNEIAAIVQNGQVTDVIEGGKVRVGGLLKTDGYFKDVEVVIMDSSPKDANWQVGELWTADQYEIAAKGLLRYRIIDPKKFFTMVYAYSSVDEKGERFLSLEHINDRIKSEVLTRVLQPETTNVEIGKFYGNRELQFKIENVIEQQLKQTLDMWGLELLKFTSEWDLGDYTGLIKKRREFETKEEEEELGTLSIEGGLERAGRVKVAEVRKDFAPISVKTELENALEIKKVKAQIEKELMEDEADLRSAQEALQIKKQMHLVKANGTRAELEVEQDMKDREHIREIQRLRLITERGGAPKMEKEDKNKPCIACTIKIPSNSKYCPECGALQKEKKKYCIYDGTEMPSDAKVCPNPACGKEVTSGGKESKTCIRPNCGCQIAVPAKYCSECGQYQEQAGTMPNTKESEAGAKDDRQSKT